MSEKILPVQPVMDPHKNYVEINSYVVFWGLFYAAVFALAVGYLGLKIGQTIDAFAPVSILAMGMAIVFRRQNAFAETVHIQAIASAGTNGLAGALFFLPAFYILNIEGISFFQMATPIVLGSVLGVFLCVMFRRYFCEDMHFVYPFPAGRAATEVLTSNGGSKAKLMMVSGAIGMFYDFVLNTLGWWQEVIRTNTFKWGLLLQEKTKLTASLDTDAALLGLGYFTGLRYAAIIAAGSFFSWFVCMPIVYYLAPEHVMQVDGQNVLLADVPVDVVFRHYIRHIGIGMLAMAGIIGLISMSKVVSGVVKKAITDIFSSKTVEVNLPRSQRDMPMSVLVLGIIVTTFLFALFFHVNYAENLTQTVLAFFIVLIMSFLLSVVGISSIAYTGNEPVSGMTIFMIIVAALILTSAGVSGTVGMIAILMMAAFVGTTIGMAGNFMSEMKVAHLTGATPAKMQQWQIVSAIMASILSVGVLILLNNAYGFTGEHPLPAPQANAMAAADDRRKRTMAALHGGCALCRRAVDDESAAAGLCPRHLSADGNQQPDPGRRPDCPLRGQQQQGRKTERAAPQRRQHHRLRPGCWWRYRQPVQRGAAHRRRGCLHDRLVGNPGGYLPRHRHLRRPLHLPLQGCRQAETGLRRNRRKKPLSGIAAFLCREVRCPPSGVNTGLAKVL